MNSKLRARIAALEGPPPVATPTVILVKKDGTSQELPWYEAMFGILDDEDSIADVRYGDADMANLCAAMLNKVDDSNFERTKTDESGRNEDDSSC